MCDEVSYILMIRSILMCQIVDTLVVAKKMKCLFFCQCMQFCKRKKLALAVIFTVFIGVLTIFKSRLIKVIERVDHIHCVRKRHGVRLSRKLIE